MTLRIDARVCILLASAVLSGCPDAVRGQAADEGGVEPGGGGATDGGAAETSSPFDAASGMPVQVAALSGHVALGASTVFVGTSDGIFGVAKSGGEPSRIVPSSKLWHPVAADATYVYYSGDTLSLDAVWPDGTHPKHIASSAAYLPVALDGGRIFWVTSSSSVESMALGDAQPTTVRKADSERDPYLMGVTAHYVVLGIHDAYAQNPRIVRRPRNDASKPDEIVAQSANLRALAIEGGQAYWLEADNGIRASDVEGTAPLAAVSGPPAMFDGQALALDATHVYWTSRSEGRVYRAARATGVAEIFAAGFDFPDETILDRGFDRSGASGRIAVDEGAVWVSDSKALYRASKR